MSSEIGGMRAEASMKSKIIHFQDETQAFVNRS